ncbi:MAG: flagellar hook-basal body complex protein FliE [Lachnospiraceae bacterium]|nr:flagellar hook-basal body complex protein FliE [Lachnospiraceae bacterium]
MDVSNINAMYKTTNVPAAGYGTNSVVDKNNKAANSFDSVLNSVMGMVGETNTLQNKASAEEIKFALGESDNTHDLLVAEQKASVALQYTVAVRDKFIDAYKEIMNMQM